MATGTWPSPAPGKWELLWENPSPSSQFAAGKVPLTIGTQDMVAIGFSTTNSGSNNFAGGLMFGRTGYTLSVTGVTGAPAQRIRSGYIETDGITFSNGEEAGVTQNNALKPIVVYILKDAFA